jgi:hypothetical protein
MTTGFVLSRQTTEHLTRSATAQVNFSLLKPVIVKTLADAERAHITATLRETNGIIGGPRGAAAQLGLPRTTLVAKMRRLGISNGTSRSRSGHPSRQWVPVTGSACSSRVTDDSVRHLSCAYWKQ